MNELISRIINHGNRPVSRESLGPRIAVFRRVNYGECGVNTGDGAECTRVLDEWLRVETTSATGQATSPPPSR